MKRGFGGTLAAWLALACAWAGAAELRLVTLSYPPYEYLENGVAKGMAVELVEEAARRTRLSVEIRVLPWARALQEVREGGADGIFTIFRTPEREQYLDYGREVLLSQVISLFVRKTANIQYDGDLATLAPYRFGVVNQVSYGPRFDQAVKQGLLPKRDVTYNFPQSVEMLVRGRFDILVAPYDVARHLLRAAGTFDRVRVLTPDVDSVPCYLAFTRKRDLSRMRDQLDQALRDMRQDGSYQAIVDRYTR